MKPVLIIRTGRAPDAIRARHGDFPHWFRLGARLPTQQLQVVDVAAGDALPAPNAVAGGALMPASPLAIAPLIASTKAGDDFSRSVSPFSGRKASRNTIEEILSLIFSAIPLTMMPPYEWATSTMFDRFSHLITFSMSVICVERLISFVSK